MAVNFQNHLEILSPNCANTCCTSRMEQIRRKVLRIFGIYSGNQCCWNGKFVEAHLLSSYSKDDPLFLLPCAFEPGLKCEAFCVLWAKSIISTSNVGRLIIYVTFYLF